MQIPIYSKPEIDYAKSEGNYSFAEFEEYLNEFISGFYLDDAALGIAKKAFSEGTKGLSDKQLYVLEKGMAAYDLEHCVRCHTVLVIKKGRQEEGPFFCSLCLDEIRAME